MNTFLKWLAAVAALGLAWWLIVPKRASLSAGPVQLTLSAPQPAISKAGFSLTPLATYSIEARVLGILHYKGGEADELAPYDVAVGWGLMAQTSVLERLDISLGARFYRWRYWGEKPPIPVEQIFTHSANMHLIPADEHVLAQIGALEPGMIVRMQGVLVEAVHPRGIAPWRSSLARDDEGPGACELMLVRTCDAR
jgi:hypothetical protein